jgi:sterol desaturase/sphingolipid hydroxylase (fatty acid hydroxylase superfamily)
MDIKELMSGPHQVFDMMAFFAVFMLCLNLELIFGVTPKDLKYKNFKTNCLFILPGLVLQSFLGVLFLKMLIFENQNQWGILPHFGIYGVFGQLAAVFIVLDFFYWVYHFLMHKYKWFWRFHAIHHSDRVLNVSTSLREHPIETIIRLSHYILASCILGPAFWIIGLHQFIQVVSKIIIHSNWRLPDRIDKVLSYFVLTPNMHHVHHHYMQPFTDSNFGDLFSIWDRAFGTFKYLPKEEVVFGIDVNVFEQTQNLRFKNLIKLPFTKENLSN